MTKQRLDWLDAAKGGAILLVAFHHSILWLQPAELAHPIYDQIDYLLKQARMPLFFLASGIAASFIYQAPRREYFAFKLLPIAWIYILWTIIYGFAFEGVGSAWPWQAGGLFDYLPKAMVAPDHGLWFVFALWIVCFLAIITRGLPQWLVLAGALGMTLHNDFGLPPYYYPVFPNWIVHNILNYTVFFFVGLFGARRIIEGVVSIRTMWTLLGVSVLGFIAVNLIAAQSETLFWRTQTLRAAGGTGIGLALSVLLTRVDRLGPALAWFGQRSLGVFLGHGLFLVPLVTLLPASLHGSETLSTVMPLIVTVIVSAAATLLYLGASRIGLRWLYILPKSVGRSLLDRSARALSV